MNSEIKERIEQINKGIVPEGYKKTKGGIIPEDWEVKELGEVSNSYSGGTPRTTEKEYYEGGNIPWIRSQDLNKKAIFEVDGYITDKGLKNSSAKEIKRGTLLVALYGATSGTPAISYIDATINQAVLAIELKKGCKYFYYNYLLFNRNRIINKFTQGGQPNLSGGLIKSFKIPTPYPQEQEKIAGILSTWDKAIENIEKLIEEKKEQKKGLMQKLLTGETRVPGFSGEWKEIKLGELLDYEQPDKYTTNNIYDEETEQKKVPVLTANKAFILGYTDDTEGIYEDTPVIIFDDFTTDSKYVNFRFKIRSSAIKLLKCKEDTNLKFIFDRMQLIKYPMGGHKRYYISEYQFIKLEIPSLEEQKVIAEILSTADREIELLKELLENKKEEKRGLMQLLLTGIVRV